MCAHECLDVTASSPKLVDSGHYRVVPPATARHERWEGGAAGGGGGRRARGGPWAGRRGRAGAHCWSAGSE